MSVITSISNKRRNASTPAEADQYDGLWLNPGIFVATDGDESGENKKFVRFNRGVAISDLKVRKIYETMDPDFAAEQMLLNERIEAIQAKALTLQEGEHIVVNLPMVLYRRMEEANVAPTPKADRKAIDSELFG
jgi:hypothetical protein